MKETAVLFLATFGAAVMSYIGNRKLFQLFGESAAVTAVPWWEEGCKAVAVALIPGSPVLGVHLLFGSMELLYDLLRSRAEGLYLGLLSLAAHGLAGGIAALLVGRGSGLFWAYAAAGAAHALLNVLLVSIILPVLRVGAASE